MQAAIRPPAMGKSTGSSSQLPDMDFTSFFYPSLWAAGALQQLQPPVDQTHQGPHPHAQGHIENQKAADGQLMLPPAGHFGPPLPAGAAPDGQHGGDVVHGIEHRAGRQTEQGGQRLPLDGQSGHRQAVLGGKAGQQRQPAQGQSPHREGKPGGWVPPRRPSQVAPVVAAPARPDHGPRPHKNHGLGKGVGQHLKAGGGHAGPAAQSQSQEDIGD